MPSKFPVEKKFEIVMESLTSDMPIVRLCRKYGVSVAQFHRWKDKFIESGKKGLGESSGGNEYELQINELKQLIGDQALVIETFKKTLQGRRR